MQAHSDYVKAKIAFWLIMIILTGAIVLLAITGDADGNPRHDAGRYPGNDCPAHQHNGLWGDGCGRFTTHGHHGGGVRG